MAYGTSVPQNVRMEVEDNSIDNLGVNKEIAMFPTEDSRLNNTYVNCNLDVLIKTEPPETTATQYLSSENNYIIPDHPSEFLASSCSEREITPNENGHQSFFNVLDAHLNDGNCFPRLTEEEKENGTTCDLQDRSMAPYIKSGKRTNLTLEEKVRVLQEVDKGILSKSEIAKTFQMAKSSLSTLIRNKVKIMNAYKTGTFRKTQKSLRSSAYPKLEECLITWLKKARTQNVRIHRKNIKEQAEKYALQLGIDNFTQSDGWVARFKERRSLTVKRVPGDGGTVDKKVRKKCLQQDLQDIIKKYPTSDIFSAAETCVFYQALPDRTKAFMNDCSAACKTEERVTLLLATNMDGSEKLPLLFVSNAKAPRCFKGIPKLTMPVNYTSSKKAWMTTDNWETWLRKTDQNFQQRNRKICLIVDSCSAHGEVTGLKAIEIIFLPTNATLIMQLMDQGIARALKINYRLAVCRRIILCTDCGKDYALNLLSAMSLLVEAWRNVSRATISNCFRLSGIVHPYEVPINTGIIAETAYDIIPPGSQTGNCTTSNSTSPDTTGSCKRKTQEGAALLSALRNRGFEVDEQVNFDDYVNIDQNVETYETFSDEQIVKSVLANEHTEIRSSDDESNSDGDDDIVNIIKEPPITSEVFNAIDVLKRFYYQEENASVIVGYLQTIESDFTIRKTKNLVSDNTQTSKTCAEVNTMEY